MQQPHALRRAPGLANLLSFCPDDFAVLADDHHVRILADLRDADNLPVAFRRLHVDDALAAARLQPILLSRSALAITILGDGKNERALLRNDDGAFLFFLLLFLAHLRRARLCGDGHADDIVALVEVHAADAVSLAAHG